MNGQKELNKLLKSAEPELNEGEYVFCTVSENEEQPFQSILQFYEEEGSTLVIERKKADDAGIAYKNIFCWITLTVHSSLKAVGFTASFSSALAKQGIRCNVVAGYYHGHLFVPKEDAKKAIKVLSGLGDDQPD